MIKFDGKEYPFFPRLGLKLTGACSWNCPFCCEPNRKQPVYPIDNLIKITSKLNDWGTKRLCLTGGEPLFYPDLEKLLKHTSELGFFNLLLSCNGEMLVNKIESFYKYLGAVRLSVHDIGDGHDTIVGGKGAFIHIEKALSVLYDYNVETYVTTVVTPLNISSILQIADWCIQFNVKTLFLFGMMKSGSGGKFIEEYGEVPEKEILSIIDTLSRKYSEDLLKVIYYDYKKNAECILIYGDGNVVIDPYPNSPSFQLGIGNVFTDTSNQILDNFNQDPNNSLGHCEHLRRNFENFL